MKQEDFSIPRCKWVNLKNPLYIDYHDTNWGVPEHNDSKLFKLLLLENFQAGLSWECILNKWENFRSSFDNFDVNKIANYDEVKCSELLTNPGIIRNRLKINAVIENAKIFKQIQAKYGSFGTYIWGFTDNQVIFEEYALRTTSPLSDTISRDLRKRGMKFVGSSIIYAYLQAIGIINGHGKECHLYHRIR